jgi:hypothetical protein
MVQVTSFAFDHFRPQSSTGQQTAGMTDLQIAGERVLLTLVDVAPRPEMSSNQRHRFWRRIFPEFIEDRPGRPDTWTSATWTLDGQPLDAMVVGFAGMWAGVAFPTRGSGVGVVAQGLTPEDIALKTVTDSAPYHFSLTDPVSQDLASLSYRAAFGDAAVDDYFETLDEFERDEQDDETHPDYLPSLASDDSD